jgi:hypothetical protein
LTDVSDGNIDMIYKLKWKFKNQFDYYPMLITSSIKRAYADMHIKNIQSHAFATIALLALYILRNSNNLPQPSIDFHGTHGSVCPIVAAK